ncbi:hypothetical protein NMS_0432 [Nonlabens marinus S1-08]|uniref:Uncharacterized protein n=1 Tax=Nonlabens marinus S1-08 TaxID=1454201 RepID=W8VZE6_9FLAO|nr:hypothetical protein NMS_0432 [Nonlabens marinus S1-08]
MLSRKRKSLYYFTIIKKPSNSIGIRRLFKRLESLKLHSLHTPFSA